MFEAQHDGARDLVIYRQPKDAVEGSTLCAALPGLSTPARSRRYPAAMPIPTRSAAATTAIAIHTTRDRASSGDDRLGGGSGSIGTVPPNDVAGLGAGACATGAAGDDASAARWWTAA
ncbi:hypothetical protein BE11_28385 [Sorangium cellulosum]|nr:hypothetical protein BE11_28385 [Sorangium cellulosum]